MTDEPSFLYYNYCWRLILDSMTLSSVQILVVENETNHLEGLVHILQWAEYGVVPVFADDLIIDDLMVEGEFPYSLIIIDQSTNDSSDGVAVKSAQAFNSFKFSHSLKENPSLKNIPFLLLCELDNLAELPAPLFGSELDILLLPIRSAELLMRISNLLSIGALLKQKDERTLELNSCKLQRMDLHAQLIASEKTAALGRSVAGFSHELNTPMGLCITAATYLNDASKQASKALNDKSISEEAVRSYIHTVDETVDIILSNLNRSTEMVANFKMVAVDVLSEKPRSFVLHDYLKRVINSLTPALRKCQHEVAVTGDDLVIDSYPGALSQVITNIIMNSIIHAFDDEVKGKIVIRVVHDGSNVHLNCSDDGRGMTNESLTKVFEAYYTTREGQGGSGLGTSIIYKLVTETLQGQISCSSELGVGTMFTITIPVHVSLGDAD